MFKELFEAKQSIYSVHIVGNFWGGRYYEQGLDSIFVLASSPSEAKKIAEKNVDLITEFQKNKILHGGKRALAKKDNVKIKIGATEPKLTSMKFFRNTLTKNNKFEQISIDA